MQENKMFRMIARQLLFLQTLSITLNSTPIVKRRSRQRFSCAITFDSSSIFPLHDHNSASQRDKMKLNHVVLER